MLSRVSGRQSISLRKFFFDVVYRDDKSAPLYQVARRDPKSPLDTQTQQIKESEIKYEVSKLPNGVTVLTEQASHPSRVDLGILLNVGARDETSETSGSLLAIKNTYFKTIINTNETINYGVIQMSGGDFEMDYDQETSYFKAHSLSHDVVDVFKTIVDCALEPKSVVSASVAQEKNQGTHKLEEQLNTGEKFNETIFKTAFGQEGLGNPLRGYKKNIGNLSAYTLQKFQLENIHPSKIIVTAGGVYNHQEFVNLAAETLSFIPASKSEPSKRVQAQYTGGEVRNLTDDSEIAIALLFPSVAWNSNELPIYQVLNTLLGSEGHGQSIIQRNLLSKHSFIDSATGLNFNFSDAGLFGFKVIGSAEKGADLLRLTLEQLKGLANAIPADQLNRAKSLLKNRVFTALERPDDRLEEAVKSLNIFNAVKLNDYGRLIDSVTSAQINTVVANLLRKTPTLVAEGGLANRLPSYDQILNQLK